jgi:hypothetical protein
MEFHSAAVAAQSRLKTIRRIVFDAVTRSSVQQEIIIIYYKSQKQAVSGIFFLGFTTNLPQAFKELKTLTGCKKQRFLHPVCL